MTYFADLSEYRYLLEYSRLHTVNVGWLEKDRQFEMAVPTEGFLRVLWEYCKVSVAQTRGIHKCELCSDSAWYKAEREGETLLLGAAEIRVFSSAMNIFAAPTLIYHYVSVHHYKAPAPFVEAVLMMPSPPDRAYFERLAACDLEWADTSSPSDRPPFKF